MPQRAWNAKRERQYQHVSQIILLSPVRGSQIPSSGITKRRAPGGVIAVGKGIPRLEVVT
jgi:hypothetical protein